MTPGMNNISIDFGYALSQDSTAIRQTSQLTVSSLVIVLAYGLFFCYYTGY